MEPGLWDEMRHADGRLRDGWSDFACWLPPPPRGTLAEDLDRRLAQVVRQIRHDGITHNVVRRAGRGAAACRWMLPLIVHSADWALIEAGGGAARGADGDGAAAPTAAAPAARGLVPAGAAARHPATCVRCAAWRRPAACGCTSSPSTRYARPAALAGAGLPQPEPLGAGLRAAQPAGLAPVPRCLPRAARTAHRQHRRLLDALGEPARRVAGGRSPRVVLLTPGPYSGPTTQHAYLSRYLGCRWSRAATWWCATSVCS